MAITVRPTEQEETLIEYAKEVTGEKTASKALLKLCEEHRKLSHKYDETTRSERTYRSRAHNAESLLNQLQTFLNKLNNFKGT